MRAEEGKINVDGYQIWYRRVGTGGIPLLTLHGGPGAGHDYLEPLERLTTDRSVIFYDQLGCGKSDQPDDRSLELLRQEEESDEISCEPTSTCSNNPMPGAGNPPL